VHKVAEHTHVPAVDAASEPRAMEISVSTTTSTVSEYRKAPKAEAPSGTASRSEGDVRSAVKVQLSHESENHGTKESEIPETTETRVLQEADSHVDNFAEPDGYHPMILEVSKRNV
jgi:hypothetical protein